MCIAKTRQFNTRKVHTFIEKISDNFRKIGMQMQCFFKNEFHSGKMYMEFTSLYVEY